MNNIIYNGQSLRDLGFAVKNHPVHSVADRDLEFASVIGRSGDYIVDNYRYKNVDIPPYEINMLDFDRLQNTDENERRLIDWLMTGDGSYKRFEDSTVPGYFCKAICTNIGEIQRNDINGFLNTSLQFNREPFWYSNEGQNVIEFKGSRTDFTIINPERYYSEPYIKIAPANYSSGIGETARLIISVKSTDTLRSIPKKLMFFAAILILILLQDLIIFRFLNREKTLFQFGSEQAPVLL